MPAQVMKGYPNIFGKYFKQENKRLWLLSQQHSQNRSNPGPASSWFIIKWNIREDTSQGGQCTVKQGSGREIEMMAWPGELLQELQGNIDY